MAKKQKIKKKWWLEGVCGGIIGFVNGFLGSGGGMIAVPLLEKSKKLDNKHAHATAIAVILPLSLISSLIYAFNFELDWLTVGILAGSVTLGGVLGCFCLKKLSCKVIRVIFALVMAFGGVWMLVV